MSDEASTPSSKSTGSVVLDNQRVYDLFMSRIDRQVFEINLKSLIGISGVIIGIFTIVVFISMKIVPLVLKNYADEAADSAVEKAVEKAVTPAVKEAISAIQFDLGVTDLKFRMLNLDRSRGFTSEEAEEIIQTIQSLVL